MTLLFDALPAAVRPLRDLPPSALRPTTWEPPTKPLNLEGVQRLCVDVERKDPDLNRLGPGTFRGTARVCGLAVGTDDGRRAYYPVAHEAGGNCDWDVWRWAREELNRFQGEVVGAKLIYDLEALAHEQQITFPRAAGYHDVQLAEAVIDEWRLRYGLDALAQDYLGERKVETRLREIAALRKWSGDELKGNLWRLNGRDVGEYGEGDVDLPLRVLPLQLAKLKADEQLHVYDLERELIPVLLEMRLRGVRVATTVRIEEVRDRMLRERARWEKEVHRLLGSSANPASSDTLGSFLSDRGLEVPRSPKGKWSVTKEFLEKNAGDAAVNAIASFRRVSTLVSLTLDSLLEHRTPAGRVHPEFNQLKGEDENGKLRGSIARLSSSNPNAQQIPTRQSEFDHLLFADAVEKFDVTEEIRGLWLPDEGETWESDDACLVGDTEIITIDGPRTIRDIVYDPIPVLSSPDAKSVRFNEVTAAQYIGVRPVYKVELKDGSSVTCTAEHGWIDFHGKRIETKDLVSRYTGLPKKKRTAGTKLARVNTYGKRYQFWWLRSNRNGYPCAHLTATFLYGPKPIGYDVDYVNGDASDWTRNNVRYLPIKLNRGAAAGSWWRKASPEQRAEKSSSLTNGVRSNRRSYAGNENPNAGNKGHLSEHRWITDGSRNRRVRSEVPDGWRYGRSVGSNHRVVSVEYAGEEPVYAITVANDHTYVLTNGLISSNSQVEYRLQVAYAVGPKSDWAREKYRSDPTTDFHKLAAEMLRVDPEDQKRRKRVKNTNFAFSYGAREDKLAITFNCSLEEATRFVAEYKRELPFVPATYDKAAEWAIRRGYVETIYGRKCRFPFWEPRGNRRGKPGYVPPLPLERARVEYAGRPLVLANTYKALNRKLQGSCADLMKKAMVEVRRLGLTRPSALGPLLITVHDELCSSVKPTRESLEAAAELKRVMETCVPLPRDVPLLVKTERGPSWGAVKEVK